MGRPIFLALCINSTNGISSIRLTRFDPSYNSCLLSINLRRIHLVGYHFSKANPREAPWTNPLATRRKMFRYWNDFRWRRSNSTETGDGKKTNCTVRLTQGLPLMRNKSVVRNRKGKKSTWEPFWSNSSLLIEMDSQKHFGKQCRFWTGLLKVLQK